MVRIGRKYVPPPTGRPAILVPTKWAAKFSSHCRACRLPMEVGTPVEGVRPEGGKWEVWHDTPECHLKAQNANWFLPAALKDQIKAAAVDKKTMTATVEDEWMRAYDQS